MGLTGGSLTLFRVRGVPVRAHWTLLLSMVWMTPLFAMRFADVAKVSGVDPSSVVLPPIAWGLLVSIALFASVAVHELAHTIVAQRAGGRVREITLMLLGGVSQIEHMPSRPRTEAVMAAAGPITSLLLGLVLLAALRLPLPADLHLGCFYLAQLNFVLGLFNLLPAFPMDGGRVLRALLTLRLGALRATRAAAWVGKAAAVAFGLWAFMGGGFFLALLALFLYTGAEAETRAQVQKDALVNLRVADVMAWHPATIPADATLDVALSRMRDASRLDLAVVDERGVPIGILFAADVAAVLPVHRPDLRVADLGSQLAKRAIVVDPEDAADAALERAGRKGATYLLAVEGGSLIGLLGRAELQNALALRALAPDSGNSSVPSPAR
jgi:Zn-dependent protease/CBS domain-containing protein